MKLEDLLLQVEKPARYAGGEYNQPDMNKPHKLRYCLSFIDIYEVAMSNLGIQILYNDINTHPDMICERCFAPWFDLATLLRKYNMPLMSIETKKPLLEFDVLGFSIQYELAYTNILYMFELAHIPFRAKNRDDSYPIIVAGGPSTANPEPYKDFFDLIIIGDGEEVTTAYCEVIIKYKGNKAKILEECAKIVGIYVPSVHDTAKDTVIKRVIKNIDTALFPTKPLVPNIEIIHDRPVIELFRGCYAGCRFCQACFFYRPIRYRECDTVVEIAKKLIKNTGADELGLSSLSSGDYDGLKDVIQTLLPITKDCNVNLQLPSLRLDSYSAEITASARKSSLTFAPEAGTQRLRDVINKNISEEEIEQTMRRAFAEGYRTVKLYFMLGLPTETDEDVLGISKIVKRVQEIYFDVKHNKSLTINVSTSMFIPKPLTPFQWCAQISPEEMIRRQIILRSELRQLRGVNYSWHGAESSMLEGVFARGDSRLSYFVEEAYKLGCYFDGWSEHFHYDKWQQAIVNCGIDVLEYTGERALDEKLAWDYIDCGVTRKFFLSEYKLALEGKTSEGCYNDCKGCGANKLAACRHNKTIKPKVKE